MVIIFIIIIVVIMYVNHQNTDKTVDEPKEEKRTGEENYKKRLNLYKNAIEQNRYHSIRKLERDYHIPAYTVFLDLKKLQEEGYFHNIKLDYDKDEIIYLDEVQPNNAKQKHNDIPKQQQAKSKQMPSYTKLNNSDARNSQKPKEEKIPAVQKEQKVVPVSESENVVAHMEDAVQQENTIPFYTKDSKQMETSPEYQADYGNGEVEYKYTAEYPDTSHIWDDLNTELFPDTHDMILCPSCGTENIIVRDATGKCYCFYCQEELS